VHIGRVWLSARAHAYPGSPHALTKHKLVFDNLYANGVGCICRVEGRLKKPLRASPRGTPIIGASKAKLDLIQVNLDQQFFLNSNNNS
jgi:hypothetical protein